MTPPGCPGGGDNVPVTVPRYAERQPQAAPVRPVVCVWTWQNTGRTRRGQLIVPDGCVDLVWREGRLEVVGPDRGPRTVTAPGGSAIAGIRLRPGAAGLLLGRVPAPELLDTQVPLEEFDAGGARRLADGLAHADGPWAAARLLDRYVSGLLPRYRPDPVVERAVAVLGRPGAVRLPRLADALGLSERQLRRRVTEAVGYGPKTLQGVLRFQRALALGRSGGAGTAQVAARAGYADQPHLSREVRRLAGVPPAVLFGRSAQR